MASFCKLFIFYHFLIILSGLFVVCFTWQMLPLSLNKKQVICITITNPIYLVICNVSGFENKLITTTTLANKRETWTSFKCDSVFFNVWLNKNLQAMGKKLYQLHNWNPNTYKLPVLHCIPSAKVCVWVCGVEHDEIVWNTTKSHCNQSLLTQQRGSLPAVKRWSSASSDRNWTQLFLTQWFRL